ncbi:unnamed protein product [Absidia cylindrospora]
MIFQITWIVSSFLFKKGNYVVDSVWTNPFDPLHGTQENVDIESARCVSHPELS